MKSIAWSVLPLVVACGSATPPPEPAAFARATPTRWKRTRPPRPVKDTTAPTPTRETDRVLPNGLRVVIVEHHRRPIVSIRTVFRQGSAYDAREDIGATFFAVSLLGGFYEVDENQQPIVEADSFARKVFYSGGELKIDVTADQAYIGIDGYAKDTSTYLEMLAKAIRKPRCGPSSFDIRRNAMINSLEEVELSDAPVLQLFIDRAAFGRGHPYARPIFGSIETLKQLSLRGIQMRQRELLNPQGATLLIVGDVKPGPTLAAVQQTFGRWRRRKTTGERRIRPPRVPRRARALMIPRSPAASTIMCAARPLAHTDGDRATLQVLAQILGGGLDSRLGTSLRMRSGYSYSMNAWLLDRRHARALIACSQVRAKDTPAALKTFRRTLDELAAAPPTADELLRAKRRLQATRSVRDSSAGASTASWLEALALGQRRPQDERGFDRVTAGQVHAAARRILDASTVRFVLGGRASVGQRAAAAAGLGPVQRVRLDL